MILKAKDLRDKTIAELKEELEDLRKQLFTSKMDFHSRRLENSSVMREIKKSVARILTVIKEKEGEKNA
jgi:large subunit ribosomal protein L29